MTKSEAVRGESSHRSPSQQRDPSSNERNVTYLAWLQQGMKPLLEFLVKPVRTLRQYPVDALRADVMAGLTVAVIVLPQAMAYALIAELPPAFGLYATVIGAVIGALWGSSHHLQTGPTNTTSLLVLSGLLAVAQPGTPDFLVAAGMMAVIVGAIQIAMAIARLGVMVNFISDAVIVGFTAGAGVLIAINQMRHLLRLTVPSMPSLWETIPALLEHLSETHLVSLFVGAGTIAIILVLRRVNRRLPTPLIAMVAAAVGVALGGLDAQGVRVVGEIPRGLPPFVALPIFDTSFIARLAAGSLAVAAIALVESLSIARSISAQSGQRLDSNQEFFGQGLANVVSGFFSGYVVAGSFTRSVVNYEAGARTSLANVFASAFVLLIMLVLAPLAAFVPLPALAGVIIVTAYSLVERHEIVRIWRSNHGDRTIMLVTLVATLALPLEYAVLMGIVLSVIYYLLRTSKPRVRVVLPSKDFRYFTPRPEMPSCTQLGVVEILGDLYFGAVSHIEESIERNLEENPTQRYLLLRMYPVEHCDISGIHALEKIVRTYRDRGGDVYFVHVHQAVRALMQSTGFRSLVGEDHFLDPDEAIPFLFHRVLDPAICIYECPVRVFRYCQNLPKRLDLACPSYTLDYDVGSVSTIESKDLWSVLHSDEPPRIIDVREPREYKQGHIPQAISIPFGELLASPSRVPQDEPVVLVCQGGRRSLRAAAFLLDQGYPDARAMEGGMSVWESEELLTAVELRQ
ncbi:MAG: sulfate permease [Anaerolineae bacterium]